MPWPEETLGFLEPRFNRKFGTYLRNSPTRDQKACLYNFFQELRNGYVPNRYRKIKDIYILYACEHVIFLAGGGRRAHKIVPAYK